MFLATSKAKNLDSQIIRKYIYQNKGMHPRIFCRRWFGLESLEQDGRMRFTESQILAMESEHGYREQCIHLIAKILKIKPNTIQRWGKGVEFNKMPSDKCHQYELYLGYIDVLRVLTVNIAQYDEGLLLKILNDYNSSNFHCRDILNRKNYTLAEINN